MLSEFSLLGEVDFEVGEIEDLFDDEEAFLWGEFVFRFEALKDIKTQKTQNLLQMLVRYAVPLIRVQHLKSNANVLIGLPTRYKISFLFKFP